MTDTPIRIQRKRTKGWRMPANTISVTRPGPYGNRYTIEGAREAGYLGTDIELAQCCVNQFEADIASAERDHTPYMPFAFGDPAYLGPLRGKNLACWCRLCPRHDALGGKPLDEHCPDCKPCHVDPLGRIANR